MKKILIISLKKHNNFGGIENYNRKLSAILNANDYDVSEFYFMDNICGIEDVRYIHPVFNPDILAMHTKYLTVKNPIKRMYIMFKIHIKIRKFIYSIYSKYDLIIDCTSVYFKKFKNKENYIWVQHANPNYYYGQNSNMLYSIKFKIFNILLFKTLNPFDKAKNIVLYDAFNKDVIKRKQNIRYHCIPLCSYNEKYILNNKHDYQLSKHTKIIYMGRINQTAKNVNFLVEAAYYSKKQIELWGKKEIPYHEGKTKYMGEYLPNQIKSILENTKILVLVSNFEGFSYVLVEALSHGIPIIIRNTFPSANFLTSKGTGVLIDKNKSPIFFSEAINQMSDVIDDDEYLKYVSNCFAFSLDELTIDKFEKKWIGLVNSILFRS